MQFGSLRLIGRIHACHDHRCADNLSNAQRFAQRQRAGQNGNDRGYADKRGRFVHADFRNRRIGQEKRRNRTADALIEHRRKKRSASRRKRQQLRKRAMRCRFAKRQQAVKRRAARSTNTLYSA